MLMKLEKKQNDWDFSAEGRTKKDKQKEWGKSKIEKMMEVIML